MSSNGNMGPKKPKKFERSTHRRGCAGDMLCAEIFDGWFCNHFLKYAPSDRPLLLRPDTLSNGHIVESCRAQSAQSDYFCSTPQYYPFPLDKGCFGPLKSHWRDRFISENPGKVVTRYEECYRWV